MKHKNSTGGGYSSQIKHFCLILLVLTIAALFVACDDDSSSSIPNPSKPSSSTTCTVTFYDGEEQTSTYECAKGNTAERPDRDPTKNDYAFMGWGKDQSKEDLFNFKTSITEDLKLYAIWKPATSSEKLDYGYVTKDGAQVTNELTVGKKEGATLDDKIYIPAKTESKSNATVTEIKEGAFKGTFIKAVYIPQSVTKIASDAFESCSSLLAINYGGTLEQFLTAIGSDTLTGAENATVYCRDGSKTFSKTE